MRVFFFALLLIATQALAAGPQTVAKSDRSLWPEAIDLQSAFDRASRAEMLVFAAALNEASSLDKAALKERFHIKSASTATVAKIRNRLMAVLVENMKVAHRSCAEGEPFCEQADSASAMIVAGTAIAAHVPAKYRPWLENAQKFHSAYAQELVRLAALFPTVSSEADTYNDNERNGFELPDGHFLMTFDDGPTIKDGNTDKLLPILAQNNIHALFFLLGDKLQDRLATQDADSLQQLYTGQCVGLHGWHHFSHQKWKDWQSSVLDTQQLAESTLPQVYRPYFRPPYGQRRSDSGKFFKANKLTVALWNMDSVDWNAAVSPEDDANRVLTLMLLWRRGVVLMHDIQPKAEIAVPWILKNTQGSGIVWDDCHGY